MDETTINPSESTPEVENEQTVPPTTDVEGENVEQPETEGGSEENQEETPDTENSTEEDIDPDFGVIFDDTIDENMGVDTENAFESMVIDLRETFIIRTTVIENKNVTASIRMDYNKPIIEVRSSANITRVAYARGKILLTDFELYMNDSSVNPCNIVEVGSLEELSTNGFSGVGIYTIYIENEYRNNTILHCVSTFPAPEIDVYQENTNIKIDIDSELDLNVVKIARGYKDLNYFLLEGIELPITSDNQRSFIHTPDHQILGKYTVYTTLTSGESFIKEVLLGNDFLGSNTNIEDSTTKYYSLMTNYAPNELIRFYNNLNFVYPLCADSIDNIQLNELLENKENVRGYNLSDYENFIPLGYVPILDKFVDEANNLIIKFNIPVNSNNNSNDHFIYGFVVYSETDKKPVLVFRMDEPTRKENTINVDFTLPLPIILQNPRDEYPKHIFDETHAIVTKDYLDSVLTNYDNRYAYASRLTVEDIKHRLDQKFTHLDPELEQIKKDLNIITVTKDEINEYYDNANNLLNETLRESGKFKNEILELKDIVVNNINSLLSNALKQINDESERAIEELKYLIDKSPRTTELGQKGLWKFLEIPNNDNHLHKFHFKVDFQNGRKVYFYLDLYTSTLDVKVDNEMDIPYPHIRFASANSEPFCDDEDAGKFGVSFLFAKEANKTVFYFYVYQPCELTHSGNYYIIPNIQFVSEDISVNNYKKYELGTARTYVLTKYQENEHNIRYVDGAPIREAAERSVPIETFLAEKDATAKKFGGMVFEFEEMKKNLLSAHSAQTASILSEVDSIRKKYEALGLDFRHQNFTSNGTFNKPANASYIYVFAQGGTGATLGSAAGGVSSFGNYLTAAGGVGSTEGVGQKGETKSAFIEVTESSVPVRVGSGGIVMVSYSLRT